ncbi:MAG: hypothetical protein K8I65_00320 [Thermoanaerobaculia bacterium]|nr:hypothetical protein [Thermoanaerobaculia bacterium]
MNWIAIRFFGCLAIGVAGFLKVIVGPGPSMDDQIAALSWGTAGCPGLAQQLVAWQDQLLLNHWEFELFCGPAESKESLLLGQVHRDREAQAAQIWIRDGLTIAYQQVVLVHELAHAGVAGDRWWVPHGRDEEEYVEELEEVLYRRHRAAVRQKMLQAARLRGSLPASRPLPQVRYLDQPEFLREVRTRASSPARTPAAGRP